VGLLIVGRGEPERGGIPTFLSWLSSTAAAHRSAVTFLNLSPGVDTPGGRWRFTNLRRSVRDAAAVARHTSRHDIVHIHTAMAPASTAVRAALLCGAARVRGGRVLLHVHGGRLPLWATTRGRRGLLRLSLSTAHQVATVSQETFATVGALVGQPRVTLISNGVDTQAFHPAVAAASRTPPVILYVGHLSPRKGVGDLLEAARALSASGVDHELMIIGGAPDEGAAHAVTIDAARHPTVRYRGPLAPADMPAAYRDADVLCLPSWWEAMPLSVLEGMASGLPVVATDVGDVRTAVEDGHNGLLVRPRAPEELTAALAALLKDPELRRRMGANGRRAAEEHWSDHETWGQIQDAYRQLERR
jgi:glycosyltransferase involved in cell wall biosynthesis